MRDASARHYMEYAYRAMEQGINPCGMAGKAIAHVFDDSSDDLRADILRMIADVDTYLATFTPSTVAPEPFLASDAEVVRFYIKHERAPYLASAAGVKA